MAQQVCLVIFFKILTHLNKHKGWARTSGHCYLIPTTTIECKKWTPHRPYFIAMPYHYKRVSLSHVDM